jgi:hypothetical protein
MSVPLLVIKVHIFRIISLSIARKQKKYDRITDISKTKMTLLVPVHQNRGILNISIVQNPSVHARPPVFVAEGGSIGCWV